jgi:hypothetical protein
MLLSKALKIQ